MIKKILFATDLGPYTSHALLHVESLSRSYDATINLVHAVPPISDFAAAIVKSHCSETVKAEVLSAPHIKGLLECVRNEIFEQIATNALVEENMVKRISEIIVVPGYPASVILDEAKRCQADIIVIGSHGAESIDNRLLGSVANKILQLAKVPVFLVPMTKLNANHQFLDISPSVNG